MGDDLRKCTASLCASLSAVLEYAESSSRSLRDIVSQPPVHIDSLADSFLRKLNGVTDAVAADLKNLESMACGTISTTELVGHCDAALGVLARHADAIEARLVSFGYVPPEDSDSDEAEEPELDDAEKTDEVGASMTTRCFGGSTSVPRPYSSYRFDDDDAFEESVSLKNLGLSEACLAALSSQGTTDLSGRTVKLYEKPESTGDDQKIRSEPELIPPPEETKGQEGSIKASKEDYEKLPPYMKSLASWEELQEAITKLNLYFGGENAKGNVALNKDDAGKIGLGSKGRSYLLILLRLNQLTMETVDGSVFYTLRKNDS